MTPPEHERAQKLLAMLEKSPDDVFLLYAIAMEYRKAGDLPLAVGYFERVIEADHGYCAAYHQMGLMYEEAGKIQEAKKALRDGIVVAQRKGDVHAMSEMEAALETLS